MRYIVFSSVLLTCIGQLCCRKGNEQKHKCPTKLSYACNELIASPIRYLLLHTEGPRSAGTLNVRAGLASFGPEERQKRLGPRGHGARKPGFPSLGCERLARFARLITTLDARLNLMAGVGFEIEMSPKMENYDIPYSRFRLLDGFNCRRTF